VCDTEETADDVTENSGVKSVQVPGLKGNPYYTGQVFSDDASWFRKAGVAGMKEARKIVRKEQQAWAKEHLQGRTVKHPELDKEILFSKNSIKEYLNQSLDNKYYEVKNVIIQNLKSILPKSKYRGITEYKGRHSHIFEISLLGEKFYLIANEQQGMGIVFHSITDSPKVLIDIKK
jgi:hypothetical protein